MANLSPAVSQIRIGASDRYWSGFRAQRKNRAGDGNVVGDDAVGDALEQDERIGLNGQRVAQGHRDIVCDQNDAAPGRTGSGQEPANRTWRVGQHLQRAIGPQAPKRRRQAEVSAAGEAHQGAAEPIAQDNPVG